MGPPEGPCLLFSLRVRSALTIRQVCPSFADLNRTCAPMNRSFGSSGDSTIGNVHWKRYFRSPAPQPIGLSRSEERRVGREWRRLWCLKHVQKNMKDNGYR